MAASVPVVAPNVFGGGCVALFIGTAIAGAAGVGGGGMYVPLLLAIMGYEFKVAAVYSTITVLGNATSQLFLINLWKRHPFRHTKPLISFEIILFMLPAQLAGSSVGAIVNAVFPNFLLYILALCALSYSSFESFRRGIAQFRFELQKYAKRHPESCIASCMQCNIGSFCCGCCIDGDESDAKSITHVFVESDISSLTNSTFSRSQSSGQERTNSKQKSNKVSTVIQSSKNPIAHADKLTNTADLNAPVPTYIEIKPSPALLAKQQIATPTADVEAPTFTSTNSLRESLSVSLGRTSQSKTNFNKLPIEWPFRLIINILLTWLIFMGFYIASSAFLVCTVAYDALYTVSFVPLVVGTIIGVFDVKRMKEQEQMNTTTTNNIQNTNSNRSNSQNNNNNNGTQTIEQTPDNHTLHNVNVNTRSDGYNNPIVLLVLVFVIGMLCKLIGIGGGELLMVVLVVLGIPAIVNSATISVLEFATGLATTLSNIANARVVYSIGALYFFIGFVGGTIGRSFGVMVVERFRLSAIIILTLSLVLALSVPLYIYYLATYNQEDIVFTSFCPTSS